MTTSNKKKLTKEEKSELLSILKMRFEKNMHRHKGVVWDLVQAKLHTSASKLWTLSRMEKTGGEPDVVLFDKKTGEYVFYDCAPESPKGRRSLCYDEIALDSRKENKPEHSAVGMAHSMGADLLTEEEYRKLQKIETVDTKTSSWIETPHAIRKLGGALFGDYRYETVFVYHNGAESYYGVRGFRVSLRV